MSLKKFVLKWYTGVGQKQSIFLLGGYMISSATPLDNRWPVPINRTKAHRFVRFLLGVGFCIFVVTLFSTIFMSLILCCIRFINNIIWYAYIGWSNCGWWCLCHHEVYVMTRLMPWQGLCHDETYVMTRPCDDEVPVITAIAM